MKRVFHFFLVYSPLASCKKSEKINAPILIKRLTERRTDALSWNRMTLQPSREYNKMKVYNACDSTSLRTKLEKITKSYINKSQKDENCFETASGITSLYYDTKLQALWTYFYIFIIRLLTLDAKYWRVDKSWHAFKFEKTGWQTIRFCHQKPNLYWENMAACLPFCTASTRFSYFWYFS